MIGFLVGQGFAPAAIAEILDDGTSAHTIANMQRRWRLSVGGGKDYLDLCLPLGSRRKADLAELARKLDVTPAEVVRRVLAAFLDGHDVEVADRPKSLSPTT